MSPVIWCNQTSLCGIIPPPNSAGGAGTPVINGGSPLSVSFIMPSEPNQNITTITATNSPTSWSITSGNGSGFFALDNSGNLTVTATGAPSTGLQVTSYNLTVTASNGIGTSSPCTITVSVASLAYPSEFNRPSVSGSSISWTGPPNGGPSTSSDTSQSHSITTTAGFTSSADGQVIQYIDCSGTVTIANNNVLLRRSRISVVTISSQFSGFALEDCDMNVIDCLTSVMYGVTIRRCYFHDTENMITKNVVGSYVKDNYFTRATGADCDFFETNAGSTGNTVTNNTFEGPVLPGGFLNSGINGTNLSVIGSPGNDVSFTADRNRFLNMTDHAPINDDNRQGVGQVFGSYTNNGFFNCSINAGAPLFTNSYKLNFSVDVVNTGNLTLGSTSPTPSSSLCFGTGIC